MGSYLTGYSDPRAPKYMVPAIDPAVAGQYEGIRSGINIDAKARYGNYAQPVTFPNSLQLMVAAEAWFLKAEAALRGWAGAGTAQTDYETGISTSFAQYGLSASSYITNTANTAAPYVDPKAITPGQNDIPAGSPCSAR
ncbi:SusD/RagB family nutrient-binding outer membrane lipoprotein [Puia sp. P3]|uniref:SusD/RagB family nutrient-binding outer membrane lipoprotein n=1 Tax=Puia sp. P3 TaxID=3423952 RepID=UPI003D678DE3